MSKKKRAKNKEQKVTSKQKEAKSKEQNLFI